jgi:hypothetical protein
MVITIPKSSLLLNFVIELISYGTLCKGIEDIEDMLDNHEGNLWNFNDDLGYQGTHKSHTKTTRSPYIISQYYGMMALKYRSILIWSLRMTVSQAAYTLNHELFDHPSWKRLKAKSHQFSHHLEGVFI